MSNDWSLRAERGTPLMLQVIRWIALHLGRPAARALLYPITAYFLLLAPSARRASLDYLRRIRGRPAHWPAAAAHIHHFAATILDRVFFLTGKYESFDIEVHNADLVFERVSAGGGCILLGSHLGSFEVLRTLAVSRQRLPLKVLMQEGHNEMITRILHALNPEVADTVIPLGRPDALIKAYECLQQGHLIGILGDRVADTAKTVRCDFLGAEAAFPTGPMLAAAALRAPVILFFGLYRGGGRYEIHFELFSEGVTIARDRRARDLQHWVQRYADRLAYYARLAPCNWFNFYDFWKPAA